VLAQVMQRRAADVSCQVGTLLSMVAAYAFTAFEKPATAETADARIPRAGW